MALSSSVLPILFGAAASKPNALYGLKIPGLDRLRKFIQGAVSGAAGVTAFETVSTAPTDQSVIPTVADFTTVDGFVQAFAEGRLTGPGLAIAAIALFITAGGGRARIAGLITGLAGAIAVAQGVTLQDGVAVAQDIMARLAPIIEGASGPAGAPSS